VAPSVCWIAAPAFGRRNAAERNDSYRQVVHDLRPTTYGDLWLGVDQMYGRAKTNWTVKPRGAVPKSVVMIKTQYDKSKYCWIFATFAHCFQTAVCTKYNKIITQHWQLVQRCNFLSYKSCSEIKSQTIRPTLSGSRPKAWKIPLLSVSIRP